MQARFVCLAHNLMVLASTQIIGIEDDKKPNALDKRWEAAAAHGAHRRDATSRPQYRNPRKRTQIAADRKDISAGQALPRRQSPCQPKAYAVERALCDLLTTHHFTPMLFTF